MEVMLAWDYDVLTMPVVSTHAINALSGASKVENVDLGSVLNFEPCSRYLFV